MVPEYLSLELIICVFPEYPHIDTDKNQVCKAFNLRFAGELFTAVCLEDLRPLSSSLGVLAML